MPAEHIRKAKKSKSKFGVDDRVEVKIKSKWVKGRVKRTHKDGTIDVDASNGEKARRVDVGRAPATTARMAMTRRSASANTRCAPNLKVGQRSTTASSRRRI